MSKSKIDAGIPLKIYSRISDGLTPCIRCDELEFWEGIKYWYDIETETEFISFQFGIQWIYSIWKKDSSI